MRARSRLVSYVFALLFLTAAAGVGAPPAEGSTPWIDRPIGELGDVKLVRFSGNKVFDDVVLRDFLDNDPDVMSAAHRTGYLKDYVATLEARLELGYRHAGFNNVDVKAEFLEKEKRIDVGIDEGPRYRYGEVKVTGNTTVPTAELVKWLTSGAPDEKSAVGFDPDQAEGASRTWVDKDGKPLGLLKPKWPIGEFVKFSVVATTEFKSLLRRAYAEHGLFDPTFDVNISTKGTTADLIVHVRNEGAPATIDEVVVSGQLRNEAKEILKLVDVQPGSRFDRKLRSRVERALWRSARFRDFTVSYEAAEDGSVSRTKKDEDSEEKKTAKKEEGQTASSAVPSTLYKVTPSTPSRLRVTVVESPHIPPLGKPWSDEQEAMRKFRNWLAESGTRGDEFVLSLQLGEMLTLEGVLAPAEGFLIEWSFIGRKPGAVRRTYGLQSTEKVVGLYSFDQGNKLEFAPTRSSWVVQLSVTETDDAEKPIYLGLGFGTRGVPEGIPVKTLDLSSHMSPAATITYARKRDDPTKTACKIKDGVMTIDFGDGMSATTDAATGKLLGANLLKSESAIEAGAHFLMGNRCEVKVERGAFARRLKQWEPKLAVLRNRFDDAKPIHSTVNFLLDDAGWNELTEEHAAEVKRLMRVLRVARDADLAMPLVDAYLAVFPHGMKGKGGPNQGSPLAVDSSDIFPRFAEAVFPRGSWPWLQTREFGLALTKRSRHTREALEREIERDAWGPLALSTAAIGAKKFDYYYLAEPWAAKGLTKLTTADFERDCRPLTAESHLSGRLVHGLAKFTRNLEPADAEVLIGYVDQNAPTVAAFMKLLRAEPKEPVDKLLVTTLRKAWSREAQSRLAGLMSMWLK